jgi:hypothetical protein
MDAKAAKPLPAGIFLDKPSLHLREGVPQLRTPPLFRTLRDVRFNIIPLWIDLPEWKNAVTSNHLA